VKSILDGNLKAGLEIIENTLSRGYDVYQIYKGLIYILRNMMIMKVCEGVPPFLYIGEDEYKRVAVLLKDLEYYEIQNMLHYMLKAEDLLRGFFPKVSLEILYINLYNLTKLRDVERIIDNLGTHSYKRDEGHGHDIDETEEHESGQDIKGFIEYLKKKKPLVGSIFDTLQINIEGDNVIVYMDKNSNLIRGDATQKEEIKKCLKEFFGKEMGLILKDADEIKKNILDEYVKEAGTLFKV
jgi:DNA polymerase III gamma/tau subunit